MDEPNYVITELTVTLKVDPETLIEDIENSVRDSLYRLPWVQGVQVQIEN